MIPAADLKSAVNGLAPKPKPLDLGFQLIGAEEIFAELPPEDFLVDRAMRRGSVVLLGGYGSSWKTWLALGLALSVAVGQKWLGRFDCKQGRASILDWESGSYELRRRLQRIACGMGLRGAVPGVDFCAMPNAYMGTEAFAARVRKLAEHRALIVIDSLRAATPGAEENDSAMRMGLDQLRRIAEETGCVFLVLVHAKKTSTGPIKPDPREVLRGSSAIFDAADAVLVATSSKGKPVRVEQAKSRHGKAVEPFEVTMRDTILGTGVEFETADLEEQEDGTPDAKFMAACDKVLGVIRQNPGISLRQLREKAGIMARTVGAAIEWLTENGKVVNTGNNARAAYRAVGGEA